MKQASERKFDRNEVLKKCFDCLVSNGLENTSIRSFSTASGLNSSSLSMRLGTNYFLTVFWNLRNLLYLKT